MDFEGFNPNGCPKGRRGTDLVEGRRTMLEESSEIAHQTQPIPCGRAEGSDSSYREGLRAWGIPFFTGRALSATVF